MKRKRTPLAKLNTTHLRQAFARLSKRPAVEAAIESVRLRIAPTVAKVHAWCNEPAQPKKARSSAAKATT